MARPDPIQYAERLYGAIRTANFSPISFLAFGNAVKDGVSMRHMPRIAAEPFMRVVGEMLDLEEQAADDEIVEATLASNPGGDLSVEPRMPPPTDEPAPVRPSGTDEPVSTASPNQRSQSGAE